MNFVLTNEEKELLTDISSLLGVKQDTIKQVWEFTIFAWLLKFKDNPEKLCRLVIPFFGSIGIKYKSDVISNDGLTLDFDVFVSVDDNFKKLMYDAKNNNYDNVAEYLQNKYLTKIFDV